MKMKTFRLGFLILGVLLFTLGSCKKDRAEDLMPAQNHADLQHPSEGAEACESVLYSDAAAKSRMEAMEKNIQLLIADKTAAMAHGRRSATTVTIPVVFHVVYNLAEQNISDAQLQSQIDVLNEDFNAANVDVSSVPSAFQPLVGNANLQFVLARRDPNGNATTGITRTSTTVTSFSSTGAVCYTAQGGRDAWPSGQYLNIWVCNKSGAAGYSSYPWSGSPATDGIIIGYNYVGRTGTFTNNWNYQKGRTCTHEVGHWLGLIHIWGDAACGDDLVGDTPAQSAANGSCPAFPRLSSCGTNPNGDMFMNYMDYTYDACRKMFSSAQVIRMQSYIDGARASIKTSLGATAPGGTPACNVPTGLLATSITANSSVLVWASTGALSYSVRYKPTSSATWVTTSAPLLSLVTSGLSASTTYEFQVQSICSGNSSAYSPSLIFTTLAAIAPCNVPGGLTASSVTSSGAALNWSSTGAGSYNVRYKPTSSGTWISTTATSTSRSISGLSASTTYEFQIQSVCSGSSSAYSASSIFTTSAAAVPCNVPGGLAASSITTNGATLSWGSTGAVSYIVRYKAITSSTWTSVSVPATSRSISGLSANTAYEFQVQSVCSASSSAYSTSGTFTTPRNGGKKA